MHKNYLPGKPMHIDPDEEDEEEKKDEYQWSEEEELSDHDEYPPENLPDCDR